MRRFLPLLLLAGCTMSTLRVGGAALPGPASAVYADYVMALASCGVRIVQANPESGIITGQITVAEFSGTKPYLVVVRVGESKLTIQVSVSQAIDYGASERLIRRIETALKRTYPDLSLVVK
jgi:hypothetical protein